MICIQIVLVCSSGYPLKRGVLKEFMNVFLHQSWISVDCSIQNDWRKVWDFSKKHIPAKFNLSNDLRSWWLLLMVISREFHGSMATSPTLELIFEVKGIRPLPRQCVGGWGLNIYRSMCIDMCLCSNSNHIYIYIYIFTLHIFTTCTCILSSRRIYLYTFGCVCGVVVHGLYLMIVRQESPVKLDTYVEMSIN